MTNRRVSLSFLVRQLDLIRYAVPEAYAKRVCSKFAQLGARGVSVLVASGDQGTGDVNPDPETSNLCIANDGSNRTIFLPMFPASCP